jgi:hypothetical protein
MPASGPLPPLEPSLRTIGLLLAYLLAIAAAVTLTVLLSPDQLLDGTTAIICGVELVLASLLLGWRGGLAALFGPPLLMMAILAVAAIGYSDSEWSQITLFACGFYALVAGLPAVGAGLLLRAAVRRRAAA